MPIPPFTKKHSVSIYYILTIIISWGGIILVIGPGGILGTKQVSEGLMPLVYLATLLGPSVAGLVMTGLVEGKAGFRTLWSRLFSWQAGLGWYAIALLIAPVMITGTLFVLSLISPVFSPAIVAADDKVGLLLMGIVMGLAVGLFEELGWSGFALPKLRLHYGVFTTGLILGILWGLWHLPLFVGSVRSSGSIPPALYLCVLLFSFLPAYRVLMVWVYEHTGSLSSMVLMHAPLAASQLILIPPVITGRQIVTYDLVFAALLWIVVTAVAVANRRRLARRVSLTR